MSAIETKKANCKNCYKCLRNCPVKAIKFTSGQAEIMPDLCIACGTCVQVCPQGAQQAESQLKTVQRMAERGEKLVASLAPSFYGATPRPRWSSSAPALPRSRRRATCAWTTPSTRCSPSRTWRSG